MNQAVPAKPKRLGLLTSGGDAPGMNACIRSVVRTALSLGIEPVGVMRGFQGLLAREFVAMNARSVANIIQRGGTILMSSRCEAFLLPEQRSAAYLNLRREKIDALLTIGGDGTMRGVQLLGAENGLQVCGIPGTIDNDLSGTDYTIGFDTALNTALEMVDRLRDTAASYDRIMLVEVMGRKCGQIALHVALACGAEAVLLPEVKTDLDALVANLRASFERGKHSQIVVVAEGESMGGTIEISKILEAKLKIPVRFCILGHVQRGGNPTARDRILAGRLGAAAVEALARGETQFLVGELHDEIVQTPLKTCLETQRTLNAKQLDLLSVLAK